MHIIYYLYIYMYRNTHLSPIYICIIYTCVEVRSVVMYVYILIFKYARVCIRPLIIM